MSLLPIPSKDKECNIANRETRLNVSKASMPTAGNMIKGPWGPEILVLHISAFIFNSAGIHMSSDLNICLSNFALFI